MTQTNHCRVRFSWSPLARGAVAIGMVGVLGSGSMAARVQPAGAPVVSKPGLEAPAKGDPPALAARVGETDLRQFAARNVVRMAFADLGLQEQPITRDHRLASILLGIAQDLAPDDNVMRWRLGAATGAHDTALSISLCRQILKLDPRDTVVQLRLIELLLDDSHTAEERLARLRRLVGDGSEKLDPSVRSRLAMDAAALCQQLGDEKGFVELLKRATSLDSTNRDAAATAAAFYADRVDDPVGRLELLGNLLLAEPADVETQSAIARELSAMGCFAEAKRFQDNVARLYNNEAVELPMVVQRENMFTRWGIEGPVAVVRELNTQIQVYRIQAQRQIEEMEKALVSTEGITRPEDRRLEPLTERLRLVASVLAGDSATTVASAVDLRATVVARIGELADVQKRPEEIDEAKARALSIGLRLGLLDSYGWANIYAPPLPASSADAAPAVPDSAPPGPGSSPDAAFQPPPADPATPPRAAPPKDNELLAEIEQVVAEYSVDPANLDVQTARGWALLRAGKPDEAKACFAAVNDQRLSAMVGMAEVHRAKGEKDEAIAVYKSIWRSAPQSLEAMVSYSMLRELLGQTDVEPELAQRARRFVAGIPRWIDTMSEGGQTFMNMEIDAFPSAAGALDKTALRLRVRNTLPVPMGIGPDRSINSQILIGSSMEVGLASVRAYLKPEVTSIARRLRLMPNEVVEMTYWPDAGSAGWVLEQSCDRTVHQQWRAIQGFVQDEGGAFKPGPMCLTRDTNGQVRSALPQSALTPAELAVRLTEAPEQELPAIAALVRAKLLNPFTDASGKPRTVSEDDAKALASAAGARYPSLSREARMLLLAVLPQALIIPEMKAFDDAARSEADPAAAVLFLVSRVTAKDDPFLIASATASDPSLAATAAIVMERLADGVDGYASLGGPDVQGIIEASNPKAEVDPLAVDPGANR